MEIKKITWQLRRDFTAIFECEHCGFEEKRDGYDDAFFHRNVIPSMKCDKCGKCGNNNCGPRRQGEGQREQNHGRGDGRSQKDCADHWEMIKACVFVTLLIVWLIFAIWRKYVS